MRVPILQTTCVARIRPRPLVLVLGTTTSDTTTHTCHPCCCCGCPTGEGRLGEACRRAPGWWWWKAVSSWCVVLVVMAVVVVVIARWRWRRGGAGGATAADSSPAEVQLVGQLGFGLGHAAAATRAQGFIIKVIRLNERSRQEVLAHHPLIVLLWAVQGHWPMCETVNL